MPWWLDFQTRAVVRRLFIDPADPQPAALEPAVHAIRRGELVVIPTDTLYGLAGNPLSGDAVQRIFDVKGREAAQALPLIAADIAQVRSVFGELPAPGRQLADRFWPGPLTLLLEPPAAIASGVSGRTGRIGVRVPAHSVAQLLCRLCGHPLTATSANKSGQPATDDPDDVMVALGDAAPVAVLLDAGRTAGGLPSTIVDVSGSLTSPVTLVRAGAIPWEDIQGCLRL